MQDRPILAGSGTILAWPGCGWSSPGAGSGSSPEVRLPLSIAAPENGAHRPPVVAQQPGHGRTEQDAPVGEIDELDHAPGVEPADGGPVLRCLLAANRKMCPGGELFQEPARPAHLGPAGPDAVDDEPAPVPVAAHPHEPPGHELSEDLRPGLPLAAPFLAVGVESRP